MAAAAAADHPYLYSEADIAALMAAARRARWPLSAATYETLVGFLTVTGMRVGEAIRLDRTDVSLTEACSPSGSRSSASPGSWRSTPAPSRRYAATPLRPTPRRVVADAR